MKNNNCKQYLSAVISAQIQLLEIYRNWIFLSEEVILLIMIYVINVWLFWKENVL